MALATQKRIKEAKDNAGKNSRIFAGKRIQSLAPRKDTDVNTLQQDVREIVRLYAAICLMPVADMLGDVADYDGRGKKLPGHGDDAPTVESNTDRLIEILNRGNDPLPA